MSEVQTIFGDEKFITGINGAVESVVMPIQEYSNLIELIEEYKLGLFLKAEESTEELSKSEALRFLELD